MSIRRFQRLAASYRSLARVLRARGEWDESRRMLHDVLRFQSERFGPDHGQTSRSRAELGGLEVDVGNVTEGLEMLERAWPGVAEQLHARHSRRLHIERDLERGRVLARRDS